MSLYVVIKEIQNTTAKRYLKQEQRFSENKLIREIWSQMAQDISKQIASLQALPKSFWISLKKDQDERLKTIQAETKKQTIEKTIDTSLSNSIDSAIQSEEAIILKIYVPLIRNLRKNWTGPALDFYIIVKAHIVRIKRFAESFSGDPAVLQHATLLSQQFEKEIQEPEIELKPAKPKPASKTKTSHVKKPAKPKTKAVKQKPNPVKPAKKPVKTKIKAVKTKAQSGKKATVKEKPKKSSKKVQSLADRSKMRRSRTKPLAEKTDRRRRRAQR